MFQELFKHAMNIAKKAIQYDEESQYGMAFNSYLEAASYIESNLERCSAVGLDQNKYKCRISYLLHSQLYYDRENHEFEANPLPMKARSL